MLFKYPKISVITVVYNASATIQSTAESVFYQSYPNFEYIIIDGKSTDGTIDIIKKFKDKLGYWISEKDEGIYDAMNKGVNAATGEWIFFLGADDVFYNKQILKTIFNTNTDGIDFIYGDVLLKSSGKTFGGPRTYEQLIQRNINHQSIFYKKKVFYTVGQFNLRYKILADYDFNFRVFRNEKLTKKYMPEIITLFNDKGKSHNIIDSVFFKDHLQYLLSVDKLSLKDNRLQQYYFYYGFSKIFKHKWIDGLKDVMHSVLYGKRKFYYFLVAGKFFLSMVGLQKKIRVV